MANDEREEIEDDDQVVIVRGPAAIIDKFFGDEGYDDDGDEDGDDEEADFEAFKKWQRARKRNQVKRTRHEDERDTGTESGSGRKRRRGYFD